jgi:ATP-dependent helicase/nuclease subunit A
MARADRGGSAALPDEAARRAIREDLGTTLLVEAAAGTGKTESLVDRMVALIRTGRTSIDRLSAVTFTIKAAAELSQRFQTRLEEAARAAEGGERERIEAALARLDTAFVGTIHAFCARLLRERPVEAGVDPGFDEMEQPEDEVARQEAWERYAERLFSQESPILPRLSSLGIRLEDLRKTFDELCENEDVTPAVPPETPPPDFAGPRRAVSDFLRRAEADLPPQSPPGGWNDYQEAARRALRLEALLPLDDPAAFIEVIEALDRARKKAKEAGRLAAAFEALCHDVIEPALQCWREHRYPIAMAAVVPAVAGYAAWRRRHGRLNFQDLLLLARDLLRDHADVRRAFQERFLPILVDEFQDTDPIQAEILFYLTGRDHAERDWRAATPIAGSLFVVGDPKQSIYRFRRADILTYGLVRDRIDSAGRVLRLSTNFRSTGRLCGWVNGVFRGAFPAASTPEQAAFVPLEPHREEGGTAVFRLETRTASSAVAGVIDQDSTRIARAIAHAVARRERKPGDFLVLFRNRKYMSAYARKLEAEGLACELAGGGAFADSEELAALLSLLSALADPDDPVSWLAVLRGPLFGVDDEALYRFARAGGRFSYRAGPPAGADPRIVAASALARVAVGLTATLPPAAAIARLCERLGWIAYAASRELGDSRAGNLLKALSAARRFSSDGLDFSGVVAELTRMTRGGYIEEMSVEPGRRDAVRLLTVHGAKGLEAPVVFLADPRPDPHRPPRFWIDREREPAEGHWMVAREGREFRTISIAQPPEWEAMCDREKAFDEAEKTRLLYVAATRAREMLVVSTWKQGKGNAKGTWAAFDPKLSDDLPESPAAPAAAVAPRAPDPAGPLSAFRAARAARREASSRHTYAVSPVTALAHAAAEKPAWESTGRGLSWGRVLHAVLEAVMRDATLDLPSFAENALAEEERPAADLPEVLRVVEAVRSSELWARARRAKRCLVEVPFALRVAPEEIGLAGGPSDSLLQGAIDLVFEEEDGWTLIDYKSDTVGENLPELIAFYTPQVELYRRYWEQMTRRPTRAGLFFIASGEPVWLASSP